MIHRALILALAVAACGDDGGGASDAGPDQDGAADAGPTSFQIQSDEVEIPGGAEFVTCFYFRPPAGDFRIRSIQSRTTGPVADITVFSTAQELMPPGTQTGFDCGWIHNAGVDGKWVYSSYQAEDEYTFPADDGDGRPLGMLLPDGTSAYVRIHSLNEDPANPAATQVEIDFEGHPADADITIADSLLAHADDIEIIAMATGQSIHSCTLPAGLQFTSLSTFSHKQSIHTFLFDTVAKVFESTTFANPGARRAEAAPFIPLVGDVLTYRCDYNNQTIRTINDGDNPALDENCIAVGYFFPAEAPIRCTNNSTL